VHPPYGIEGKGEQKVKIGDGSKRIGAKEKVKGGELPRRLKNS
jgi:hypothetical protein